MYTHTMESYSAFKKGGNPVILEWWLPGAGGVREKGDADPMYKVAAIQDE